MTIQAIYENGVFRPVGPVELPENARVEFEPRLSSPESSEPSYTVDPARSILMQGVETGITDLAARHNEQQP